MMVTTGLSYIVFIILRYVFSLPNLFKTFIMKGCFLSVAFSALIEMIMGFLYPPFMWNLIYLSYLFIYMCWTAYISGMNTTCSQCIIFLMCSWVCFVSILLGVLASMFIVLFYVFILFWYRSNTDSVKEFGSIFFFFYLIEYFYTYHL